MASIDVGIHPDPSGITAHHFPGGPPATFSTIEVRTGVAKAAIFVSGRSVLNALQAALDEIRADMDKAEQAAMKATRTERADAIKAAWQAEAAAQAASDQVPTVMADWPAGPPDEALGVFGK